MRLDQCLVERGLVASRSRARDLVLRGLVQVEGETCDKPARIIQRDQSISIQGIAQNYVSRGAEKLIAALQHFEFEARGRIVIDVGASTGGFTEVLLERGVSKVYAVDTGTAQLHKRLRGDARVVCLENTDARELSSRIVSEPIGAIVADLSFVSATKVLAPVLQLATPGAWLVVLIKPQFEVGPEKVGKGGIVRDQEARESAVRAVVAWLSAQPGWRVLGTIESPVLGGSGNQEFLAGAILDG